MKRRELLAGLGAGAVALAGCAQERPQAEAQPSGESASSGKTFSWKMVTTWPPNFPGTGTSATLLAETITKASGGRIKVHVYAAGELVPPFEVFNTVSAGAAEMGHGVSYYWKAQVEAAQFFGAIPFGMTPPESSAWLHFGGGLELWRELYEPFGVMVFTGGNTGTQMGGWFNREINTPDDLKGLKMRIPGLGGEVLRRAGGTPVMLPGGEIYTAMQTGSVDATEWVGPFNDVGFGLHEVAQYYYYPGWHEPGAILEVSINREAWEALPEDLQRVVESACGYVESRMRPEYDARNAQFLQQLRDEGKIEIRRFPDAVIEELRQRSKEVIADLIARDEQATRIYASYTAFQQRVGKWLDIGERAVVAARG